MTASASSIRTRLLDCFATVFPTLTPDEISALDHEAYDEWDSLASISLVTVIEEEFDIMIDDDALAAMTTFERTDAAVSQLVGV